MSSYDPTDDVSRANDGTGGAPAVSGGGGSEGAGNVSKPERQPSVACLLEALEAAKDCGVALRAKSVSAGFFCGKSLAALVDCAYPSK